MRNYNRSPKLTNQETYILQYLTEGYDYAEIAIRMKTSIASIHTHTSNIRKKSKIKNLKDKQLCKVYLATFAVGNREPGPTKGQSIILKMYYLQRRSLKQISDILNLSLGTVTNGASQGRKRLPFELYSSRESAAEQLREFFDEKPFSTEENPMDDPMF